jgi:hypothetical protein
MKTEKYEPLGGDTIEDACREAVRLAKLLNLAVEFDFNEKKLTARPETDPLALAQYYRDECYRLHAEYLASPEYKRQIEESVRKQRDRDGALEAALAFAPAQMSLREPELWRKSCEANTDDYGGGVITFAERWARLMEARLAKGEPIAAMADECSGLADNEGITGFMYGCAVSILAQVWTHGEALRHWHNLKVQLRDEGARANEGGGVLNPAILSLGEKI